MAITAGLAAPRRSSADVITIDDGATPGTTDIPFTCSIGDSTWLPFMGFVYRNVEAFELAPGDTIAFDIQMRAGDPDTLGFLPQLDIALAHASDPLNPFRPDDLPGSDFTTVAQNAIAASPGNRTVEDYELVFTVDTRFTFPGGGLIIRVGDPMGALATRGEVDCLPVITADAQPSGTNRLVGTFKKETGEYPWVVENTTNTPNVPYVRISWIRCGDGRVSANEECDDGNADDTDDCTNTCLAPACGDGIVQQIEECDNSADPSRPDPFCNDDTCKVAAFAKGSGCDAGGGAGLAAVLMILALVLRRRAFGAAILIAAVSWAGAAQAQMKTDGFRVDRFEMAPSVEDGLVIQDPSVLRHMAWSVSATFGFTNTILRVVPEPSSDTGVDVVGPRLSAYLDFAMGFRERFEVNVSLPFALAQSTESGVAAGIMLDKAAGTTAVGDGRVGGSVLIYGLRTGPQIGVAATVSLPVGSENSFTGDGGVGAEMLVTAGYVMPDYRVVLNGGVRIRPEADYVTSDQGTEIIARAGIIVPFANNRLNTSLELDMLARTSGGDAYKELGSPILALLGARYHFASGLRAGAGVGMGLTEAPGSPAVRTLVTIGYSPEPKKKGKKGPPPQLADADGDGILDSLDKCPKLPEDPDGSEDQDGCPDLDGDKDKIVDAPPDPAKPLTLEQVITLPAPIEFYFDTAIMRPGAEVYLRQVLLVLQQHAEVLKLEIQGHTSSEGGPEYNIRLSDDRARAVLKWLVDNGIDASRLVPRGYGLTVPLVPNDSEPNRQKNRRVQFRLLDQVPGTAPTGLQHTKQTPTAPPPAATTPTTTTPAATTPPAKPPAATPPAAKPPAATTTPAATPPPAKPPAATMPAATTPPAKPPAATNPPSATPPAAKPPAAATPPAAKPPAATTPPAAKP